MRLKQRYYWRKQKLNYTAPSAVDGNYDLFVYLLRFKIDALVGIYLNRPQYIKNIKMKAVASNTCLISFLDSISSSVWFIA